MVATMPKFVKGGKKRCAPSLYPLPRIRRYNAFTLAGRALARIRAKPGSQDVRERICSSSLAKWVIL